jgi:hypothetical protein
MRPCFAKAVLTLVLGAVCHAAAAEDKPVVGLVPKSQKALKLDGKLDDWDGAFVTPVHVGHPDFANRGAHVLFLWDEENLYVALRCLDRKPDHVGPENQIWNGDAVEFYLDTRRGDQLGRAEFAPGTLHMFWTPFTGSEVKPRLQVRATPAFKNIKLQGAAVAGETTPWGYTAEFKLPWYNFPAFNVEAGEVIGIDCELCSSDGGPRVDRTFVYSSPASVTSPTAFARVKLVDKIEPQALKPLGRVLLPWSLSKSANYDWLYSTVCVSPTIEKDVGKLEGRIVDGNGKVLKTSPAAKRAVENSDINVWRQRFELFDLPAGVYTIELTALDKEGKVITERKEKLLHGDPSAAKPESKPSPAKEGDKPPAKKESDKPPAKKEAGKPPAKKETDKPPTKKDDKSPPKEAEDPPPPKKAEKPNKKAES